MSRLRKSEPPGFEQFLRLPLKCPKMQYHGHRRLLQHKTRQFTLKPGCRRLLVAILLFPSTQVPLLYLESHRRLRHYRRHHPRSLRLTPSLRRLHVVLHSIQHINFRPLRHPKVCQSYRSHHHCLPTEKTNRCLLPTRLSMAHALISLRLKPQDLPAHGHLLPNSHPVTRSQRKIRWHLLLMKITRISLQRLVHHSHLCLLELLRHLGHG